MSSSSRCGIAVLLRIGPQPSCQLGKSFRNNAIALEALCHMSDIVENPTTSAPPNHRINLRRQSWTLCRTREVKLIGVNLVDAQHLRSGALHAHGFMADTMMRSMLLETKLAAPVSFSRQLEAAEF